MGVFLSQQLQALQQDAPAPLRASAGVLPITSLQAQHLGVRSHTQLSPALEICCRSVSANVSYQHAAEDVELFTGIQVAAKTQQRLVHRQVFEMPEVEQSVEDLSVDGGKIRMRTPEGEPCSWQEYKGVCLHEAHTIGAFFQDNATLIEWVNDQPLASPITR